MVTTKTLNTIYLQTALLVGSFVFLYYSTIGKMVRDWLNNDNYSHGFLIPLIAGYMIWHKRDELKSAQSQPSLSGLIIILTGLAIYVVGYVGAELFTMRFSIVVTILGFTIYLFGIPIGRIALLAILYLIFMIPLPAIIWNQIAFPLQLLAAKMSASSISAIGLPVLRQGNILELSNTTLEVVDACSGLRSLLSLLALSSAFAYIVPLKKWAKWILLFSAIPIAILLNVARLTAAAIMAKNIGPDAAQGFIHNISGIFIYASSIVLFYALYLLLSKHEYRSIVLKDLNNDNRRL